MALPDIPSPPPHSPTSAVIDLSALAHNLGQVRRYLPAGCDVLAVVKADAYGHGAVPVSRTLAKLGVTRFGVATVQEGAALRDAGIEGTILVMGALLPHQFPQLFPHRLTPVLYSPDVADALVKEARSRLEPYPVHVKVDTGMGRLGIQPEQVPALLQSPFFKGPLRVEGLMTHLADADGPEPAYTRRQIDRFRSLLSQLLAAGLSVPLVHAANSAGLISYPEARFNLVRPGIMLYGYLTGTITGRAPSLKPVLSLVTRVVQVRSLAEGESVGYNRAYVARRPTRIAVLPIGYADGYSRALSEQGHVLIHGAPAPVAGRICMDMTTVDVTQIPSVRPGDEAVLIGRQGTAEVSAADVAAWRGTIPYEVLCAIGTRVTRVYR
ncbi:MAG: alanine racemase [Nitrospirota bacterium]